MMDKHSETWREVSVWALAALGESRDRLEQFGVGPEETWSLRGKIANPRALLTLAEPELRVVEQPEDYGFQGVEDLGAG